MAEITFRQGLDLPPVPQMSKLIVLPAGLALTMGLIWGFGLASLVVCFALALASLLFSTEACERDRETAA